MYNRPVYILLVFRFFVVVVTLAKEERQQGNSALRKGEKRGAGRGNLWRKKSERGRWWWWRGWKVACPVRGGVTVSRQAPIPNISHFPRGYVEKYWPPNARTANPVSCSCSGANGRRSLDVS